MVREISAGGVVVRKLDGQWQVAVIEPRREAAPGKTKAVLALPKGIVDAGEKPEQTALREVHEEAGLQAEVLAKLGDIKYTYTRSWGDGERVFKIVSFYLLRFTGGEIGAIQPAMKQEVASAQWIPLEEAPRRLAYRGEKDMARKALDHLAANPLL
jgi:8-oxo-dGTP pyrophosphatase MutT (NUDIX family)